MCVELLIEDRIDYLTGKFSISGMVYTQDKLNRKKALKEDL